MKLKALSDTIIPIQKARTLVDLKSSRLRGDEEVKAICHKLEKHFSYCKIINVSGENYFSLGSYQANYEAIESDVTTYLSIKTYFKLREKTLLGEFWRPVPYENYRKKYLVSNYGRVFSLHRGNIIKENTFFSDFSPSVVLSHKGQQQSFLLTVMLGHAFLDEIEHMNNSISGYNSNCYYFSRIQGSHELNIYTLQAELNYNYAISHEAYASESEAGEENLAIPEDMLKIYQG